VVAAFVRWPAAAICDVFQPDFCSSRYGWRVSGSVAEREAPAKLWCRPRADMRLEALTSIVLPPGVEMIDCDAFSGCDVIQRVAIPPGVRSIGAFAFDACSWLHQVELPDGVTSIGADAFHCCCRLVKVTMPATVTNIGPRAFGNCCELLRVSPLPGVTAIEERTFQGCSRLRRVELSPKLTAIGHAAFEGCSALTELDLPEEVERIDAFNGCSGLTQFTIPEPVRKKIESATFRACSGLRTIRIAAIVVEIDDYAFLACSGLNHIAIPSGLPTIGYRAFDGVKDVTRLELIGDILRAKVIAALAPCLVPDARVESWTLQHLRFGTIVIGSRAAG
jgi:hypothetical protein